MAASRDTAPVEGPDPDARSDAGETSNDHTADRRGNLDPIFDPYMADPRGGFQGGDDFEVIAMFGNGNVWRGDGSNYIHGFMVDDDGDNVAS